MMKRNGMLLVAALLFVVPLSGARAQRVGIPDLSGAPADIQAIWKKVQSGSRPTMEEAQKLGQYLAAHSGEIENAAKHRADSVRVAAPKAAKLALAAGGDQSKACPTRSPALGSVPSGPISDAAARAFIDSISRKYLARETPAAARQLQATFEKITDTGRLDATAGMLYLAGYDGAAIVGHADAARRGGDGAQRYWTNLGATLVSADDPAAAVTALRRATALGPTYPLLVHQLGVAYADLGDLARAESLLTSVIKTAPKFALSWDALARVQSCTGNMTAAWVSLARAQEADWSQGREGLLSKHDPESNDDRIEAAKPFVEPTGQSIFPPPPAPPPADLSTETPVLADSWIDNLGHPAQFIHTANAYRELLVPILKDGERRSANASRAEDAAARQSDATGGNFVISVTLSNDREVIAAMEKNRDRLSARVAMVQQAYADRDSVIVRAAVARQGEILDQYQACLRATKGDEAQHRVCELPFCRAKLATFTKAYEDERDNARVFFGGMVGTGTHYDDLMRKWFLRADKPGTRISVDAERRYQLAGMAVTMFTVAATIGPNDWPSEICFDPQHVAELEALAAKAAAAGDPGSCGKIDKNVMFVFSLKGDCNSVRFTADIVPTLFDKVAATPVVEYRRASRDHPGSVFVGGSKSAPGGLASGEAGLQVNFDEGGWVQGFGPAASGKLGNDAVVALSGRAMVNLLDHGPAGDASVGFTGGGYQATLATGTGFTGNFH